jgi:hypothetical protein
MLSSPATFAACPASVKPEVAAGASSRRFAVGLTVVFAVLASFVLSRHEFWRDEIQSWLLARESSGLLDLLTRQRYEGHPGLWQALLLPLTRLSDSPAAMQVVHLVIAATTIYLFARWAPFTRLQKVLFSFGYFPFYEYTVISRSYGLGLLLLTAFCVLYPQRQRRFLALAAILVLLCHTHALTWILAAVLGGGLVGQALWSRRAGGLDLPRHFPAGVVLFGLGALTAMWQIVPPADSGVAVGWNLNPGPGAALGALRNLAEAWLPLPAWSGNFWNHPLLFERPYGLLTWIGTALVAAFAVWTAFGLKRWPFAAWFFVAGSLGLSLFFHLKYAGSARHHGLLFVVLILSWWLARSEAPHTPVEPARGAGLSTALTILLGLQVVAAGIAASIEIARPFSSAGVTAEFLQRETKPDDLLVGHLDYTTIAILARMPGRQIYYPQAGRWGSYIVWDVRRLARPTVEEIFASARALPRREGQRVILVLNYHLGDTLVAGCRLKALASFRGAIVEDENFWLYEVDVSRVS